MRPAQLTPENFPISRRGVARLNCFNEAGAINAGKLRRLVGAALVEAASMRPAQLTPENAASFVHVPAGTGCFNEAGAINAGKLSELEKMGKEIEQLQ